MDTLTHGLTGIGIAYITQEIMSTPQPGLVITAFLASELPDFDTITSSRGKAAYLKHHRGFTHSLLLSPFLALIPAFVVKVFTPQTDFWLLFLVSFLSISLHLFFDLLNSYGTKLLWPISNRRYAWDVLMIIDPWVIIVFSLGLLVHIIGKENSLLFSLFPFLGLYILSMISFRLKARKYLFNLFKNYKEFALMPPLLGWRMWNFIVRKGKVFYLGKIDAYTGMVTIKESLCEKEECNLVKATKENPEVKVFLEFARFPWFSKNEDEEEVWVEWSDLRYRLRERDHFTLSAKVKTENTL